MPLAPPSTVENRVQRLVARPWLWALVIGTLFALPLVRAFFMPRAVLPRVRGQLHAFSLTRESGRPLALADLDGKVWVAARFSPDEKSPATRALLDLEWRMRKLADAFAIVAIDPAHGDPAPLQTWANARHDKVNPRRFVLLTGAESPIQAVLRDLALDAPAVAPRANDGTLVLVDQKGRVRGSYDFAVDDQQRKETMEQLVYDAAVLVNGY